MSAIKYDNNKPKLSLIPSEAITEIGKAFTKGAEKYPAHNYKDGIEWSRLIDATMRHLNAFNDGEDFDRESGLNHVASAAANLCMLLDNIKRHPEKDDRYGTQKDSDNAAGS